MAYFEWASDMEIDQGPIDQDHRKLVDLVNTLHTVTSEGRGQQIVDRVLGELISYTADHLRREEKLMESLKFPNLASIHDLKKKYDAGSITVAAQLSTVLRDWLSLHIRRSDKELLALLKKSQPRKAPSQAGQKNIKKIGL